MTYSLFEVIIAQALRPVNIKKRKKVLDRILSVLIDRALGLCYNVAWQADVSLPTVK